MVPGGTDAYHSAVYGINACAAVGVSQACTASPAAAGAGECGQVLGRLRARARDQGVRRRLLPQRGQWRQQEEEEEEEAQEGRQVVVFFFKLVIRV